MRYALLLTIVAGCSVDHTGLGSLASDGGQLDAALADAALADAALPDATLRDAGICDGVSGAECEECPSGFARGDDGVCANVDDCAPNPCMNGGSCTDGVDEFRCMCAGPFAGPRCETRVNNCDPNPCVNGTCTDEGDGFSCDCQPGFTGLSCETNIDDCAPNPCMNDGACTDGVDAFFCRCTVEFIGETCEDFVPESELAFYNPLGTQAMPEENPLSPSASDSRVSASALTNETFGAPSGTNTNRRPVLMSAGSLDPDASFHLSLTLTPNISSDAIALSTLTYSYRSYEDGATGTLSVRTSADGFASTVSTVDWTGATRANVSFDLSGVGPTSGPLELRIYMHDLEGTERDWADLLSTSGGGGGDGMRIFGRVVAD